MSLPAIQRRKCRLIGMEIWRYVYMKISCYLTPLLYLQLGCVKAMFYANKLAKIDTLETYSVGVRGL